MLSRFKFLYASLFMVSLCFAPAQASGKSATAKKAPTTDASGILESVIPHLINDKGEKIDYKEIKDKAFVVYYFSAAWCGPCRRFTPKLVDYYNENGGKENFEVIFVSGDKSKEKMLEYMTSKKMPWVAVDHQKRGGEIKKIRPRGIPHLVLVNKKGEILARGQNNVLTKLSTLLPKKEEKKSEG